MHLINFEPFDIELRSLHQNVRQRSLSPGKVCLENKSRNWQYFLTVSEVSAVCACVIGVQNVTSACALNVNPISRLIQIQQAKKEKEPQFALLSENGVARSREFLYQV